MQRLKSTGEGRRGNERQVQNIRVIRKEGAGLRGGRVKTQGEEISKTKRKAQTMKRGEINLTRNKQKQPELLTGGKMKDNRKKDNQETVDKFPDRTAALMHPPPHPPPFLHKVAVIRSSRVFFQIPTTEIPPVLICPICERLEPDPSRCF